MLAEVYYAGVVRIRAFCYCLYEIFSTVYLFFVFVVDHFTFMIYFQSGFLQQK